MISKVFIDRPKFAIVISVVMVLAGTICLFKMPVAEYPEVAPPTIVVNASYPGASAQVIADTVAAPLEAEVNGIEDLVYYSSTSDNSGNYSLTLTFKSEADDDMAMLEEGLKIFIAAGRCRQFKPFLDQYAGPDVDPDRLRLLKIQNALELDELEEVARLFADPLKPVEIREGDFSITDSYLIWQTKLLARAEGRQWDREFHAAKMPEIPVPADYEYRTQLAVI